jgi:hypothetical protein
MPKPKKPNEKACLSRFMLMRQHRKLLAEKQSKDVRVRELTKARDEAKRNAAVSGKSWDRERRALRAAESGVVSMKQAIVEIEKELGSPQG